MTLSAFSAIFPRTPFGNLIAHFVNRLVAREEEQGSGTMGLGLGVALAILASPGAFASIFLLDKYSTLLQWLRHVHIDPLRASIADEYFFVVLSMTVTGLMMVLRWNRLLPDRRDFLNLAPLPIPIRNIFLANFSALLFLAVLLGVDVNAVSAFLFPLVVTLSDGTVPMLFHLALANAVTVLLSSLFSFFAVFALVGLLMLLSPKALFRPLSICARILLVILLLTEFLANLFLQLFSGRLPGHAASLARWLPPFWFLGVYERMLGIAKPAMFALGNQALLALAITILVAVAAYSLCYVRHFLRLAETLETVTGLRTWSLPLPSWLEKLLFRSPFEQACIGFTLKVLSRSEQHLIFFGAYLGIGLVIIVQAVADTLGRASNSRLPTSEVLGIPLLIAFFILSGLRFAFDVPAALNANWAFRVAGTDAWPSARSITRKVMLWAVVPWQLLVLIPLTAHQYGLTVGLAHGITTAALSILCIDLLLARFHKIPFTCNKEPDFKPLLARILGTMFSVLIVVPLLANLERWMLLSPPRFLVLAILLTGAWRLLWLYRRDILPEDQLLTFEERPAEMFQLLKLV